MAIEGDAANPAANVCFLGGSANPTAADFANFFDVFCNPAHNP